ncbi:ABC transporter permease [Mariluticola halotolerans]|nr:ABC transporter permease [Mariluticola halotolerans]UJQ93370.1 ABC transporter permease [Mariluticola halotolerans]
MTINSIGKTTSSGAGARVPLTGLSLGLKLLGAGPVVILLALFVVLSLGVPNFFSPRNLSNILAQIAVISVVAMGQHLVILTRGIDLSVGANLALATVLGALMFRVNDNAIVVMGTMLMAGAAVGAVNGLIFVYGRLPHAFIITLATLSIARGLALELSIGHTTMRGMPELITTIGGGSSFGVPNSFFVVVLVALLITVMARYVVWGRWIYAVGGQPDAARRMGIPVNAIIVSTYVIAGLCCGVGAILLSGRTEAGSPLYGNLLELDTIAAVIIGGASFLGGRGHIGHALVGAVMIGVIRNALNLLNVNLYFQLIAIGVIIVMAVESDVLRNHLEARMRVRQAGGAR